MITRINIAVARNARDIRLTPLEFDSFDALGVWLAGSSQPRPSDDVIRDKDASGQWKMTLEGFTCPRMPGVRDGVEGYYRNKHLCALGKTSILVEDFDDMTPEQGAALPDILAFTFGNAAHVIQSPRWLPERPKLKVITLLDREARHWEVEALWDQRAAAWRELGYVSDPAQRSPGQLCYRPPAGSALVSVQGDALVVPALPEPVKPAPAHLSASGASSPIEKETFDLIVQRLTDTRAPATGCGAWADEILPVLFGIGGDVMHAENLSGDDVQRLEDALWTWLEYRQDQANDIERALENASGEVGRGTVLKKLGITKSDQVEAMFETMVYAPEREKLIAENQGIAYPVPDEKSLHEELTLDEMRARFVLVRDGGFVFDKDHPNRTLSLQHFKQAYASSKTKVVVNGEEKSVSTAQLWAASPNLQRHHLTFAPGQGLFCVSPIRTEAVNTWRAIERTDVSGHPRYAEYVKVFTDHVRYLFGDEADLFLQWLAHLEQRPGELPSYGWVHVADSTGTGRNWLASVLVRVWPGLTAPNFNLGQMLRSGFNGPLSGKVLAVVDEIRHGGGSKYDDAENIKRMITEEYRTINSKYGAQVIEANVMRWLIFSNHIDALALADNDRRWAVVHFTEAPKSVEYYKGLFPLLKNPDFIAGVSWYLRTLSLSGFELGMPPKTAAREAMIAAARSPTLQALIDIRDTWPHDVIPASRLWEEVSALDGAKPHNSALPHMFREAGLSYAAGKRRVRLNSDSQRIVVLRNPRRWWEASDYELSVVCSPQILCEFP